MLEVEQRGRITEDQILDIEQQLGVGLPVEYRSWLKSTGGGAPVEPYGIDAVDGEVNTFVGLDPEYSMADQYDGFDRLLPGDLIRIAYGNGGTIALKVTGEDIGSVWWFDHDKADVHGVTEPCYDYLNRLADTFDAFIASF